MWPICTVNNDWWLLVPLLLGLLCGWWAWGRRGSLSVGDLPGAGLVGDALDGVKDVTAKVADTASGAAGAVAAGVAGAGAAAVGVAKAAGDVVGDAAGAAVDGVKDVTAKVADTASGAAGAVAAGVAGAGVAAVGTAKAAGGAAADVAGAAVDKGKAGVAAGAAALGFTSIGVAAAVGDPDDLLKIKGIGPKLNDVLNGLGITRFDQIASWTAEDVDKVDDHLAEFKNRIGHEEWIPQAKLLAAGNHAEWERLYGTAKAAAAGAAAMLAIGIPGAVGDPDDLLKIKGIGPKLNALLTGLGITRFDQIAAWGAAEIDKVDDHLGTFKSRIGRDNWVEQAGLLARGAIAEFEAKFGKLDSENK